LTDCAEATPHVISKIVATLAVKYFQAAGRRECRTEN
jgi:hypothetical protein